MKTKTFFLMLSILTVLCLMCGCQKKTTRGQLEAPTNLSIDEMGFLSWDGVEGAGRYLVEMNAGGETAEYWTDGTSLDVFVLTCMPTDYTFTVYAYPGEGNELESEGTSMTYAPADYSSNFLYRKLEDGTGYEVRVADPEKMAGKVILPSVYDDGLPVKKIYSKGFEGCTGMTSLLIPSSVEEIGDSAFMGCTGLRRASISENVSAIPTNCFERCGSLESVNIPENAESIGNCAFSECRKLDNIKIPKHVSSISYSAFVRCPSLENFSIDTENEFYAFETGCVIDKKTNHVILALENPTIPASVTAIDGNAIECLENTEEIVIPSNIMSLDSNINYCTDLKRVTIEEGVTEIAACFKQCDGLERISIPASVRSISSSCLYEDFDLADIELAGNEFYVFETGCLVERGTNTVIFGNKNAVIPDYAESIGSRAFVKCDIRSITIPSSCKTIGSSAFTESSIESITFEEGIETIEADAFARCTNLRHVIFPSSMRTVESGAFLDCFCTVVPNDELETVGGGAFGCDTILISSSHEEMKFDSNCGGTRVYNCEIEDGYIKSIDYYPGSQTVDEDNNVYMVLPSILWGGFSFLCEYRDGYVFKGFSLNEDRSTIDFPVVEMTHTSVVTGIDEDYELTITEGFCFDVSTRISRERVMLYAIWEKIE